MNTGETIALIKAFGNGGGGSSLPAVTSADNGKVLAVKDGAWAADSNLFVVNMPTYNTADKTYEEIIAAIEAGKTVVGTYNSDYFLLAWYDSSTVALEGINIFPTASTFGSLSYMKIGKNTIPSVSSTGNLLRKVGSSDNGKILIVKDGAYVLQQKKFLVTLTPTSPDYSGTMDKTVAEITAAYEAGQEIVFKLQTSATEYIEVPIQLVGHDTTLTYPSFETSVVQSGANLQVFASTLATDDGTKQTYSTTIYSLTPAS